MAEYIERDAAMDIIRRTSGDYAAAFAELRRLPAADTATVRHGRWIEHDDGVFTCSECGNAESNESHFCRYCGAKMMEG